MDYTLQIVRFWLNTELCCILRQIRQIATDYLAREKASPEGLLDAPLTRKLGIRLERSALFSLMGPGGWGGEEF